MYLLDFDHTLLNTNAFTAYMFERLQKEGHILNSLEETTLALEKLADQGELNFAPGELGKFLYSDVPEFLRTAGNEALIVTYGNPKLQQLKVENATAGIPRVTALYTGNLRKGDFLRDRIQAYGANVLCVDDKAIELESLESACPNVRLYEIRRDGAAGDGRWPVISSLTELP